MPFGKYYGTCLYCKQELVWLPFTKSPKSKHYKGRCRVAKPTKKPRPDSTKKAKAVLFDRIALQVIGVRKCTKSVDAAFREIERILDNAGWLT